MCSIVFTHLPPSPPLLLHLLTNNHGLALRKRFGRLCRRLGGLVPGLVDGQRVAGASNWPAVCDTPMLSARRALASDPAGAAPSSGSSS